MLRVMTYNIKNGGLDGADRARLDRITEVIAGQRPDVLALQELRGFRRGGRMASVAEALGMRSFLARSWFGQPVAVLVRPPLRVLADAPVRRPFHHAAQRVVVATDAGPLTVVATHLHPYSGSRRAREAGWLVAHARRAGLALLMGDLNTLEPEGDHAERLRRLPAAFRDRHLRSDGTADTRAVEVLLREAGLVDLFRWVGGDEPGDTVPTVHGGGVEFVDARLDYVLGTPPVAARARRCFVVRGGAVEWASDHRPVVAEVDLAPAAG